MQGKLPRYQRVRLAAIEVADESIGRVHLVVECARCSYKLMRVPFAMIYGDREAGLFEQGRPLYFVPLELEVDRVRLVRLQHELRH